MTLQKCINIFLYLQDKYGSANVINEEIIEYINMASNEYLNRVFPDNEGTRINFEFDTNVVGNIQPLIWTLSGLTMDVNGRVLDSVLNTALQTATGDGDSEYFRIGGIGWTTGGQTYPVKYVKQNNLWAYSQNYYKSPNTTRPKFTVIGLGLQFYPTSDSIPLTINVIKKPKVWTVADVEEEMEFSDYVMYSILSIALKLAGIATRDQELIELDARLADIQITK